MVNKEDIITIPELIMELQEEIADEQLSANDDILVLYEDGHIIDWYYTDTMEFTQPDPSDDEEDMAEIKSIRKDFRRDKNRLVRINVGEFQEAHELKEGP